MESLESKIHNRTTELQQEYDGAMVRKSAILKGINLLRIELVKVDETIKKCEIRAEYYGRSDII